MKVPLKDIKGTDLGVLRDFICKTKSKAGVLVYFDDEGKHVVYYYRNKEGKNILKEFMDI